ncbi:hypothetical protein HO173_010501 [Letharia columbiana]|uniref:Uncharacterized protein n=1 Tax=Letharia columbiana TaxID=112416 RepID=A0A8H6L0U9_9LECA|nr:uncharacterized protein HO173_010501 [Letharia columbiana]KAF6231358.1 hypothetical protein HO173_010501 [Letharia columbiana]
MLDFVVLIEDALERSAPFIARYARESELGERTHSPREPLLKASLIQAVILLHLLEHELEAGRFCEDSPEVSGASRDSRQTLCAN